MESRSQGLTKEINNGTKGSKGTVSVTRSNIDCQKCKKITIDALRKIAGGKRTLEQLIKDIN